MSKKYCSNYPFSKFSAQLFGLTVGVKAAETASQLGINDHNPSKDVGHWPKFPVKLSCKLPPVIDEYAQMFLRE
jgi:hypothetical protein